MLTVLEKPPVKVIGAKRLVFVSDNHLGNKSTSTSMMIESLNKTVTNLEVMLDADGLIFAGDLFDRLLNLNVAGVSEINEWFIELLHLSIETKCCIRILEGTPSHDWKQSKVLYDLAQYYRLDADIKYFSELSIDVDETLGLTIGYVPDEWRESHKQTTEEFKELMSTMGLRQVDVIVMHGLFEFQIPKVNIPTFESKDWVKLVKYSIVIGHDHNHKTFKCITVPGSHNRLSMNEEANKGYVISDIYNNTMSSVFIANPYAKRYDTLELSDVSDEDALPIIIERLKILKVAESKLRLRLSDESNLQSALAEIKSQFGLVTIAIEKTSRHKQLETIEEVFSLTNSVVNINKDNVMDMILREIFEKRGEVVTDLDERLRYEMCQITEALS